MRFTFILLFSFINIFSQTGEWKVFTTSNSGLPANNIRFITVDHSGNKWVSIGDWFDNGKGIAKYNGNRWIVYDTTNSGLPSNQVNSISVDSKGNKWFGTYGAGIAMFDDSTWTIYDSSNSPLPSNEIWAITIDRNDTLWIGTDGGGLVKFFKSEWEIYDEDNSALRNNHIYSITIDGSNTKWLGTDAGIAVLKNNILTTYERKMWVSSIAIDSDGNKWIGTWGTGAKGLACFKEGVWSYLDSSNSPLPVNDIRAVVLDKYDKLWMGTGDWEYQVGGLVKYDQTNWEIFNTSNSSLSSNIIYTIVVDSNDNKWVGTSSGLVIYNENGIVDVDENNRIVLPKSILLNQNYPNPFNPTTKIRFTIPSIMKRGISKVRLVVYNSLGQKVRTLVNNNKVAGNYEVEFNASNLTSGVYFYVLRVGEFIVSKKMILLK